MYTAFGRAEDIHPSLWRASQLARGRGSTVETGYAALSAELPGGGWPVGALVDLLVQQAGVGEMRLLRPALSTLGGRPIVLIQPPHLPDGLGLSYIGLSLERLLQVKARKTADALWGPSRFCAQAVAAPSFSGCSPLRHRLCVVFTWRPSRPKPCSSWSGRWRPPRIRRRRCCAWRYDQPRKG